MPISEARKPRRKLINAGGRIVDAFEQLVSEILWMSGFWVRTSGLQEKILREEVVDYVMEKFEAGLLKELENMGSEMGRIEKRKCELEGELANLTRVIASRQLSPTIMTAIAEREREIAEITERVISSNEDSNADCKYANDSESEAKGFVRSLEWRRNRCPSRLLEAR
jgi:hypothetical protein